MLNLTAEDYVRRRDFIKAIAGSTAVWPFAARAQQAAIPVIGFFGTASAAPFAHYLAGFRQGLRETGHVEGHNVAIEFRWAEGHYDRVPALAADLAQRQVAVIVTVGGEVSALAAKAATTTIPIVFNSGGGPGQGRAGREPGPAGWQRDRREHLHLGTGREAPRPAA